MIGLLLLATPALAPALARRPAPVHLVPADDLKSEYSKRLTRAKGSVAELWKLVDWCEANGMRAERNACLRAILALDEGDRKAHELLGHVLHEGEWYPSQKKLDAHLRKVEAERRRDEARKAKEKGWILYGETWVDPADVPLLEKGWVRDEYGEWMDPEAQKRLEEGWVRQDLEWIAPDEKEALERGLWKCGERWLSPADADTYHSVLAQPWRIPGEHFVLETTLSRAVALFARKQIEDAHADLVRIYGVAPREKPRVLVLNSPAQYATFAAGDEATKRIGTDGRGMSSVYGAYFADLWIDLEAKAYRGAGVGYWDEKASTGANYGRVFARHAAGQSFADAIDPSTQTLEKWWSGAPSPFPLDAFWGEKKIPTWFRFGAASYVAQYYTDLSVGSDEDPLWPRKWSLQNLKRRGGLDPIDEILAFRVGSDDTDRAEKLINEAGLLVAYTLDGGNKSLAKEHERIRSALRALRRDPKATKGVEKAFAGLAKALKKNEKGLRAFAGM